jgi:hypothetical protein
MSSPRNRSLNLSLAAIALGFSLTGCGTPGAPQSPSLKLPEPVSDLTAIRAGNSVTLQWTMPRKTTDHLLIKGVVRVSACRREPLANCQPAGEIALAPGAKGELQDTLPPALQAGEPRRLDYLVELKSPKGRSAGLSNAAVVLAGPAPAPVAGLRAEVRADGVALHWDGSPASESVPVRLHRKLLTPPAPRSKSPQNSLVSAPQEPFLRDLLVEMAAPGLKAGALDSTARFGESYEYAAQRVERVVVDSPDGKKTLELPGETSASIRVDVIDTFPPAIPTGLVAVAAVEEKTIDLSWQSDTEEDLAGYIVYRASDTSETWVRISGAQPVIGPAYRDASAQPGQTYRYAVSAIDLTGHESKRSAEARESLPNP